MRKFFIFSFFLSVFTGCNSGTGGSNVPELLERGQAISVSSEWLNTKKAIEELRHRLRANPDDLEAKVLLAQAFLQEARITGEHPYYYPAVLKLVEEVLKKKPDHLEALYCKASALLSQHRFAEALPVAEKARALNPYSSYVYGLLCDAQLELGNYDEAIKMADKMVETRPDLKSYSRISYLREILGNHEGAISAMELAVQAGMPGLEQTAWARTTLGNLYLMKGALDFAEMHFKIALEQRPNYAFAMAGLAKIDHANKNYPAAIMKMEQALAVIPEFSFQQELARIQKTAGNLRESEANFKKVIEMLKEDEESGHLVDRELAFAYLDLGEFKKALKHAKREFERRPENIDACEIYAWTLFHKESFNEAFDLIKKSMRTNSSNPEKLCRAGIIALRAGHTAQGTEWIRKSLNFNPYVEESLKTSAEKLINEKGLSLK